MFHKKNLILLLILFSTFIFIMVLIHEKKDFIFLNNKNENIELAIYLEEEQANTIPSKESGYYYDRERSSCTNEAYINWDSITWSPVVNNMSEYKTRCEIHFTKTYTEGILNGTDPVLKDELVPVTIEENGTVKKANLESEWYSYANKNWANSVILDDQYDTLNSGGKVVGATKSDGYVTLDGVDDYIDLGLAEYDFGSQLTLVATFAINELKNQIFRIIGNWESAGVGIYINASNKLAIDVYNDETNKYYSIIFQEDLELNKEYQVIEVYNGKKIELYINEFLIDELEIEGTIKASDMPFYIGANPQPNDATREFANINVKNVQIYNRAINEEEVSLVSEGKVANSEGLLRCVDFTNKSYEDNEIIPEEAIESYFVWIPKYRYQLWDLGNYDSLTTIDASKVHEIPIIFGNYNTSDEKDGECTAPMESGKTGICQVGDYMTHPAFISIPSTGFWAGKFETGYNGAANRIEAQQNIRDSSKLIIKPNVYSWSGIQVSNAFYTSYDYKRNLDSHMMKNTEWGAIAYLQHSGYGSQANIRLNNNSDNLTGYQANNEPTCGYTGSNEECNRYCNDDTCNTAYPNSVLASTTGNITGIYDMSGGIWEYVMGVMTDENGQLMSGRNSIYNSGFNGVFGCPTCDSDSSGLTSLTGGYDFPDSKYYDVYSYSSNNVENQRRILGDATGEMGPFFQVQYLTKTRKIGSWHLDLADSIYNNEPWFVRGNNIDGGLDAGIFSIGNEYGRNRGGFSFRMVLTPN